MTKSLVRGGRAIWSATEPFIKNARKRFGLFSKNNKPIVVKSRKAADLLATLTATLDNMPQGVALYDRTQHILLANRRYAEMYGLAADDIRPGMAMKEILEKRAAMGVYIGSDPTRYVDGRVSAMERPSDEQGIERFADGRVIRKSRKPMPDGGWLSVHEDITERQRAEDQIAFMAHHDVLTGLYNRAVLRIKIEDAFTQARRHGEEFAILLLDLDDFKVINDTMGHQVGDKLLQMVADRLRAAGHTVQERQSGGYRTAGAGQLEPRATPTDARDHRDDVARANQRKSSAPA
jgi:PAS domain S-box-containing protein